LNFSSSCQLLNTCGQSRQNLPAQILTDACFIYHRQIIKQPDLEAMILRGREIAHEAANSPSIPSSMPNYSHDQIRELYGEIDKNTRRLQENEYILHTPMIDAWNEKCSWNLSSSIRNQCPLPKFRIDKNDQTIFMAAYLSTGLSNPRIIPNKSIMNTNDKEIIRGSFRTSIDDRTNISPSPLLLNVRFDFNKLNSIPTNSIEKSTFLEDIQEKISIGKQSGITTKSLLPIDVDYIHHRSLEQHLNKKSIAPTINVCLMNY
jgi:hypothetical protein